MSDETLLLTRVERLLAAHPGLEPLEAVILAALAAAGTAQTLDTGKLAREFNIEHALVRRAADILEGKGWLTAEARSGRSPGLKLTLLRTLDL